MTESEKEEKIKLIIQEFRKEAEKLEEEDKSNKDEKHTTLDNGKTKYTQLYEKYKKKIDEIK